MKFKLNKKMGLILENGVLELMYGSFLVSWMMYLYYVRNYCYWEKRRVPHVVPVFPLGSVGDIVLGRCYWGTAFDKIYREFPNERYVGLIEIRNPCLVIRDPDLIKRILSKDFHHFMDRMMNDPPPHDYIQNHLLNMRGEVWQKMRLKLTPAYTATKMKKLFGLVKKCSQDLGRVVGDVIEKNNVIDAKEILSRYTIDVIASCAFGLEINSLRNKDSEFYKIGLKVVNLHLEMLLRFFVQNSFPILSKIDLFNTVDSKITDFLRGVINSTIDFRVNQSVKRSDFLDLLIKLRQNQSIKEDDEKCNDQSNYQFSRPGKKDGLTIEEITAETFLFFIAGYETTSSTIQFCLYELACNHHIQERVYREMEEVLGDFNGDIAFQDLQRLTFMDQVINETMRRYPVVPALFRSCTETYNVPDSTLVIEKDTKLVIPTYSLHHDPEYFANPFTFDPERFSPENCEKRHPYVFLPFGQGPRMCIGYRFGLMEMKAALIALLKDFFISITPDTDVPLTLKSTTLLTMPSKPVKLIFNRRDNTVRRSLQPPYTGPYQDPEHHDKSLTRIINRQRSRVSTD